MPNVDVEETIYSYVPPNNGSSPLWSAGSTCIARVGQEVFVSGFETLPDAPLPNNVRWQLWRRDRSGWKMCQQDERGRTREPCPLGVFDDGRVLLSVNPTLAQLEREWGHPAQPHLLQFQTAEPQLPPNPLLPVWQGTPAFTEHSYRGLAVDARNHEALLLNILGHEAQYWSFLDRDGTWSAQGTLTFPTDPAIAEPLRLCYPTVALSNRSAHILAVSDIVEPVKAWREYKFAQTQRVWDYAFRRIYYTWTPDITTMPFAPWIEIANQEAQSGYVFNLDIWLAPDGTTHLLWLERTMDPRLRPAFFPADARCEATLEYAILRQGQMTAQETLLRGVEGEEGESPLYGRLHATPDGRLYTVYATVEQEGDESPWERGIAGDVRNYVRCLQGGPGDPHPLELTRPLVQFMTATERGGSPPADMLDIYGNSRQDTDMRYVRVKL